MDISLKTDPKFKATCSPLTVIEYHQLEDNIISEGFDKLQSHVLFQARLSKGDMLMGDTITDRKNDRCGFTEEVEIDGCHVCISYKMPKSEQERGSSKDTMEYIKTVLLSANAL
jgi:hypothetical protein